MIAIMVFEGLLYLVLAYIAYRILFYFLFPKGIKEVKMFRKTDSKYNEQLNKDKPTPKPTKKKGE